MTLLVFMYHRAKEGKYGNSSAMLDEHFAHMAANCNCVLPGEQLDKNRINVCISFDDGYYDFYRIVYPLLQKHSLKAILAVSPAMIVENPTATEDERLGMSHKKCYKQPQKGGFCSWSELKEMVDSGIVQIASHGMTHTRLDDKNVNLSKEIGSSKLLLQEKLGIAVESFVYPFGRFDKKAHEAVKNSYSFAFRIGQASNHGWDQQMLYRIDADNMESATALFSPLRRIGYFVKAVANKIRGV